MSSPFPKNRYADAPKNVDFTIDQDWQSYSPEEHQRWDRLFAQQKEVLPGRACDAMLNAIDQLQLSTSGIPHMERLSDRLEKLTGLACCSGGRPCSLMTFSLII